ncbi:hypothetical protein [Leptospirillum ferriphilum]|uniref:hypothetical protein n=1 Tax=Leptospirillum ferriphilum TaxID=178606 RepID=UPI001179B200|nr:hypothetical protein [Leptospirillum ferriphilum]
MIPTPINPQSVDTSKDIIHWGTIISSTIGAIVGGVIGGSISIIGNVLNNRSQNNMQKSRWDREDQLNEAKEHKDSDGTVLKEVRSVLENLYEQFSLMSPGVGITETGNMSISTVVQDPSPEFRKAGDKILTSKFSSKLIDPEIKRRMETFENTLDKFARATGFLSVQRNAGAPGTEMAKTHEERKELLKKFQEDYAALNEYIARNIGYHRL